MSRQPTGNADLHIDQEERDVAFAQASWFSTLCDVWAPMYRQRTITGLLNMQDAAPNSAANRIAFDSLRSAWRDYLAHDNHGRPVVLIGHSQGAAMLIRLLRTDIDPQPALRRQLVLAVVLGGNATVPHGRRTGGSFRRIPTCARPAEAGCVIAYSSFPHRPPLFAFFGRPGFGVSALSGEVTRPGLQVMCVNPARIGGAAPMHPELPTAMADSGVSTPWTSYPGRYTGMCRSDGGATWLQVTATHVHGDRRPVVPQALGAAWGYHVVDVNIALGDLVRDVAAAERTWRAANQR